jgi:hypothetical protein
MMWNKLGVLGSILAILSGCASTAGGGAQPVPLSSKQSLSISVVDANGSPVQAECVLNNDKGSWTTSSPGSVTVEKSTQNLTIGCKSPGKIDGSLTAIPRRPIGQRTQSDTSAAYNYPDKLLIMMGRGLTVDRWDQESAERRSK